MGFCNLNESPESCIGNRASANVRLEDKDVDALMARDFNEMSFTERQTLYEEMHGIITPTVDETEELILRSLVTFQEKIDLIVDKPAYEQAFEQNPDYVTSRGFRLMFLRAEHFNADKAASRLVRFFEGKLELFGPDSLGRPLEMDRDLDSDDIAALKTGVYQILTSRDTAGRAVFCSFLNIMPEKCYRHAVNMLKMMVYILMSTLEEDEETQKKGITAILYFLSPKAPRRQAMEFDFELHSRSPRTADWLPLKVGALHLCLDPFLSNPLKKMTISAMNQTIRVRARIHDGSHTECQYGLMSFGIPAKALPVGCDGDLRTRDHLRWMAKQRTKERVRREVGELLRSGSPRQLEELLRQSGGTARDGSCLSSFRGVLLPTNRDVLLERGKTIQDSPGNTRMRDIVLGRTAEYRAASREGRLAIRGEVVRTVAGYGGRFLKRNGDGWLVEGTEEDASKRALMAFRNAMATTPNTTMARTWAPRAPLVTPSPTDPIPSGGFVLGYPGKDFVETSTGNKRTRISEGWFR